MRRIIIDTNLFVDWMNLNAHEDIVLGTARTRILSAVVLMELQAGARTAAARSAVAKIERAHATARRIAAPLPANFSEAGDVLRRLRAGGRDVRRAAFVNDVLIALTARSHGATVVTRDGTDFEAIRRVHPFALEIVV